MAATAPPEIQVHASFPCTVALGADLNVDPSNWHWVHCLTLPLETLTTFQFSQRPYKWIRYAIGVVVGAEGDLSSSPDSLNVLDYNAVLPDKSVILYYHTSAEERQKMFPVDPNIRRTNITSSVASTRRIQFHDDVAERDGRMCVLMGANEACCDAVHLLAHSKGDTYIATYTQRRSRDPTRSDIVHDINSVQNGLFLNKFTHVDLGSDVAFLITPNFAMTTADVDPAAPPTKRRCTAHAFRLDIPFFPGDTSALPCGTQLRISDAPEWPSPILFDAVYAGAVLHHFGTQTLKDEITATWIDTFYPSGIMTAAHADNKVTVDERAAPARRTQKQVRARDQRYEARGGPDLLDMLDILPYIMVPPKEMKATFEEAAEKLEAVEQRRVEDKVNSWLKNSEP